MTDTEATSSGLHSSLELRRTCILRLFSTRAIEAQTAFGMLFFHGIESAVKNSSRGPGARAAYDALRDVLCARTQARAHAFQPGTQVAAEAPTLNEGVWQKQGFGIDAGNASGFVRLLELAAQDAAAFTGIDLPCALPAALLAFVRMETSVRQAQEDGSIKELGGYPDSAHFFSFAELGFWKLAMDPGSEFWRSLTMGAVAAQPVYLALHFLSARRLPRSVGDYGPADLLGHPQELARRLSCAPESEDLSRATVSELEYLAGRNAWSGFCR